VLCSYSSAVIRFSCCRYNRFIPDRILGNDARETLAIMMPGGGYIASPSHDYLLPETKVENVFALYETVREFGNY